MADILLTLVRHGQSIWNADGRAQGQAQVPLSELGQKQAARLAGHLAADQVGANPVTALYASDLMRCRQTAAPLVEVLGLEIRLEPGFREIDIGHWQGLTGDERQLYDPDNAAAFRADSAHMVMPGGESSQIMAARVLDALLPLLRDGAGGHLLIVTHGGPIRAVLRHYGFWPDRFWGSDMPPIGNTSRTVLRLPADHPAELLRLADMSHLPPELGT